MRVAVCTIVAQNYLAFARTLMRSLSRWQPDWERFVLLCDEAPTEVGIPPGEFSTLLYRELPLPEPRKLAFRYSILELATAVKPWLMEELFERGYDAVIYFDPDILLCSALEELESMVFGGASAVLTPHLTAPLQDSGSPGEIDILRAGTYNLGFIALGRPSVARDLLRWWQGKNEYHCIVQPDAGLFVDQKWIDLVPGMFEGVEILRHPGYNVAYWNLPLRRVHRENGTWRVDGEPLRFFHFSGFDPMRPQGFSKHQDRFDYGNLGEVVDLCDAYATRIREAGHERLRELPYAFGRFRDGARIADAARHIYRTRPAVQRDAGEDPFALPHEYFDRPVRADRRSPTLAMQGVWELRPDLQAQYPDPNGSDLEAFAGVFASAVAQECGLPVESVGAARALLSRGQEPVARSRQALGRSVWNAGRRAARILTPRQKQRIKRLLGVASSSPQGEHAAARRLVTPLPTDGDRATELPAVTVVGYFSHATGVGESARRAVDALRSARVSHRVLDCGAPGLHRRSERLVHGAPRACPVNILHVNADQVLAVTQQIAPELLEGAWNIGVWHWELSEFPECWRESFSPLQEIWAPSRFVQEALMPVSPIPVNWMPHCIDFETDSADWRTHFGLPKDRLLVLVMYDSASVRHRKNPLGAVEAFVKAFGDRPDVGLVLKARVSERHPTEHEALTSVLERVPQAHVVQGDLGREESHGLESACDIFLSLHRSEGFGLPIAECMYLGKPVVATHWSGNADFMGPENSCPVRFRLVELEQDHPPYRRGSVWAEPDIDHAVDWLRRLARDDAWRRELGRRAAASIREQLAPEVIGARQRRRLAHLGQPTKA